MREIICWGNIKHEFQRLGIKSKCTYRGFGWDDENVVYVYQLSDEQYAALESDPDENWLRDDCTSCWRYAEGSNLMFYPTKRFNVRGKYMIAWECDKDFTNTYDHLLEYLCSHVGASTEKNVTACAVDLAKLNNITLGELFRKYQGDGWCF